MFNTIIHKSFDTNILNIFGTFYLLEAFRYNRCCRGPCMQTADIPIPGGYYKIAVASKYLLC